ncbi:MAG: IclR family transcriptional regulator [Bryobacteraceae bacterium]
MTTTVAETKTERPETGRVYTVPSVEKCFEILELFQDAGSQLSLSDVLKATRVQKTTAFRILSTLERSNYISKDAATGKYQPGLRLVELSARFLSSQGILKIIKPYMEELQRQFSETVCLALRKGDKLFYVDIVESSLTLRMVATVGSTAPLHASALGKAISANLPEHELEALVLKQPMPRYTANTITGAAQLREQLRLVREQGYGEDNEEVEDGASCLAAVVFGYFGDPLGGISISGPTNRMRSQRAAMVPAITAAAKEISERIGLALHVSMTKPGESEKRR